MRRRMVDLLRTRALLPARRGLRGPLTCVLAVVLAAGCATAEPGAGSPPEADAPERPAADSADRESRRAASDRLVESGRAALRRGRLDEAADRIERAVRRDPSNGRAYLALAEVRLARDRPSEALGLLERALTLLEPETPAAGRADSLKRELEGRPEPR